MWKISTEIELENIHGEYIYLKLPNGKEIVVNNCIYKYVYSRNFLEFFVTSYVDGGSKVEAITEFYKNVKKSNSILSFLYGISIGAVIVGTRGIEEIDNPNMPAGILTKSKNINKLTMFLESINSLDEDKKKIAHIGIYYFSNSLEFCEKEFYEEAFLAAFKGIEIISNYIFKMKYKYECKECNSNYFDDLIAKNFGENIQIMVRIKRLKIIL